MQTGTRLFLGAVLAYSANMREISSADTFPARLLPVALIREHALNLDRFFQSYPHAWPLPYWAQHVHGHYLSSYPVLPALLAVPVYAVPVALFGGDSWALINALAKLSATLIAALSVVLVYRAARELGRESCAVAIALAYAFATSTWSVASQGLWGHGPAELFLAAALYGALHGEARDSFFVWAGLAAGLMVACRPPTAFVAVALLGYVFQRSRRRGVQAGLAFGAVMLGVVAYNLAGFGTAQGGYTVLNADYLAHTGIGGMWSTSLGQGLVGLLASPSRGLFVYSPVLLFVVPGLVLALRNHRRHFFHWLAGGLGASLVMLAKYTMWWGGHSFGPRYLTDVLPLLVLFLVPVWDRVLERSAPSRVGFALLFAISVGVQLVGAFYYPSARAVDWNTSPSDVDFAHDRLWDWTDPQLVRLLENGPRTPGFVE